MGFTAEVMGKQLVGDVVDYNIKFTDGAKTFSRSVKAGTSAELGVIVKKIISRLDAADNPAPDGPITLPPDDPVPDPAIEAFRRNLRKLEQATKAVGLGLIVEPYTPLTNLRNNLKAEIQADPSLLDLL